MTFAVPPDRSRPLVEHSHPLDAFIQLKTQEALDTISEETFEVAKNITLADLLASDVSRCEAISMISNIPKYWKFYNINNNRETKIISQIGAVKDLLPRKCQKSAFAAIARIKNETRGTRIEAAAANNLTLQRVKPVIQRAEPLNEVVLKELITQYIEKILKQEQTSFKYEALCTWVSFKYTRDRGLQFADVDLVRTSANTPSWKSALSNALQRFQDKDLIKYRKAKDDWFIFPD